MKNLKNIDRNFSHDGVKLRWYHHRVKWLEYVLPVVVIFIVASIWQISADVSGIDPWILPTPLQITETFWQSKGLIWQHSLQTIIETLIGFAAANIIAIITATLVDLSKWLKKAVYPLLLISQTIPIIAVAPLFIIWFGYGLLPKVIVVTLVCFFPITINLVDGYKLVDRDILHLMGAMGATKLQIFRYVKIPAALPFYFSGLRIAGTYSVMGAVIGEWLGADQGLGVLMTRSSQSFLTDRVFATIVTIVILSLIIYLIIECIARILIPWHFQDLKSLNNK